MDGKFTNLNKHIVWVVPGFAKDSADDTCMPYLQELMEFIHQNTNITLSIIALQYPFSSKSYHINRTNIYPLNGRNRWINKPLIWTKAKRILEQIHIQTPIHCIHSFWLGDTTLIAESFAQKHGIKHIAQLMGQDALPSNRHLHNKRLKHIPIIAVSKFQAQTFSNVTNRKVNAIIPFGIHHHSDINGTSDAIDILGVGSLIPLKNYDLWIDVIHRVAKINPEIKTLIIGNGPEYDRLSKMILAKQLDKQIIIKTNQSRQQVLSYMNASRIFLHTSKYESLGYVIIEAMAAGLPIICTPVGYACEVDSIFKETNPDKMTERILQLLSNSPSKISYQVPSTLETFKSLSAFYSG